MYQKQYRSFRVCNFSIQSLHKIDSIIINTAPHTVVLPRTKSQSTINRARTTFFLPFKSRKNHQRWILYQQAGPASGKQNYLAEGTVFSPWGSAHPRFLTSEKKRREERGKWERPGRKETAIQTKKEKKKRKRRKIRMNTRRIRKCLGDRHNMTFRSSITEEISSSRLLEGGALTIRGKKYPKRYLFSSVNSYVSIECKWVWKKILL